MKHLLLIFSLCTLSLSTNAQHDKGFTLETKFDFLTKSGNITPNLKGRYFFNSANALRITMAVDYSDNTNELFEIDGEGVGSVQSTQTFSTLSIGYEKHFSETRVTPYIGGEFNFGFGANNTYGSRTDSAIFINDFNYSSEQKLNSFGIHLFTGVDFHIYKGFYCGTEIGYQFNSLNYKRGEFKTEDASSTTDATTTTSIPSKNFKSFSLVNMGVLRLGWHF